MLLLGLFLFSLVLVTGRELTINNYIVKINDGILENVEPIGESSVELDLSGLDLSNIDGRTAFLNVTNLTKLNLANNSLTDLSSSWLKSLVNLKYLSVANNHIYRMSSDFFGLDNLETVDLSNNEYLSLKAISDFGRGRCDFIVKGTRITDISYGSYSFQNSVTTPKPLMPLVMVMATKCNHHYRPRPEDATNKKETVSDEKIKCPKLYEPRGEIFSGITYFANNRVEVCIENGTLQRLSILPARSAASKNCTEISFPDREKILRLSRMGIENFARGWYRAGRYSFYSIYLNYNNITELSSNLLNDLPKSVGHVFLSGNKIKRLDAGIIQNEFLLYLDLSDNRLHEIQSNALNKTNLLGLCLAGNNFTDLRFVENLPSSLTELYLRGNNISQVSANSFSKLNNLFFLDLRSNKITQLGRKSLQGLSTLQRLFLSQNGLRNIESGAFRDLGELRELNLDDNNMTEFKESVFSDLRELIFLYIDGNNLKNVTKDTFKGLPDNLRTLRLQNNGIESCEKGGFVRVPKYELNLNNNAISKIERGDINIPSLRHLDLSQNKLSEIKEENFDLPNVRVLYLKHNLIRKIEKGAFRNSGNLRYLSIWGNPIKTLQKGSLFGMNLRGQVYTDYTNFELIEGGVFFDE